ncbi:putative adenylate-forming enzyme [Halalkalibacter nanhaiisediminis]|uniref:Putative adenylate-forming enzyme n=1 Tax=Halalkalibacter nanhaiisediminis TaxID=688079 RepID=A0A562QMZ5_9BACI|nr:F390 synthetase-related protein [Halalkalibacter nanhaiisediminis]TWI58065.1 putative adenylate-forming enzyme [Halalkalibacter nanhaiisediminis]
MKINLLYLFLKEYYLARRVNRFKSIEQIKQYQEEKVRLHLSKIVPLSPFYQKRFEQHSFSEWRKLPLMDKSIMMKSFDELNTVGIKKKEAFEVALASEESRDFSPKLEDVTVGLSSGTSGNRGLFLVSQEEQVRWAGNILGKVIPTSLFFGKKQTIAFFLRANSNLYNSVNNPKIAFHFFDLLDEIENHIDRLNRYQPTIVVAPSSKLRILAQAKKEGKLSIQPLKIVSVAEALNAEDKLEIEEVFQQKVHQIYQCTEGFLAYTCPHGTLHVNEDLVIIEKEYLDKQAGKFVPVITDFTRTSQPIIRYRLNDVLTEGETCTCGSHFMTLKQIDGRCDDLFYGKRIKDEGVRILFSDFIRRAIISSSDVSLEYKVKQLTFDHINVELSLPDINERKQVQMTIKGNFEQFFKEMECVLPTISFSTYQAPPRGIKIRRVERCFQIEGGIV